MKPSSGPGADLCSARPVVVVGGPTASGKSELALRVAERHGGTVINADSMQLYRDLAIVTARPGAADLARAPHRLYGVLAGAARGSAALWRDLALAEIARVAADGRLPVVTGGTGLYLRALMAGLADIPPIPEAVRLEARARYVRDGGERFRAALIDRDPDAGKLNANDVTRLTRAWEVIEATGKSLSVWQRDSRQGAPVSLVFAMIVLDPPRDQLYQRCDRRFDAMMAAGALDEVRALRDLALDPALPVMKALGVPELVAHLAGEIPLATAIDRAKQSTRNYAKRQVTWFRHQRPGWSENTLEHGSHSYLFITGETQNEVLDQFIDRLLRKSGVKG